MAIKKIYTLGEIAEHIGASVHGDRNCEITSLATLAKAKSGQIAFLANPKYATQLSATQASAVILSKESSVGYNGNALVMANPYVGFAFTAQLLDTTPAPSDNVHPTAAIHDSAIIGNGTTVGANAVVEAGVKLADNVSIGAGVFVGKRALIGANTKVWANVTIYHDVEIGENCLIQSGTVIGSDGFGYANDAGNWIKIPQLGSVIIGNNVEIGAGTTIDRGALDNTEIHDGVILDNQIQIAHNVIIGQNTCIAGATVIAGSTEIGKHCTFGGMICIAGHITIADKTMLTGNTMVTKSIKNPGVYSSGQPAMANRDWLKHNARLNKIGELTDKVKTLSKQLENK